MYHSIDTCLPERILRTRCSFAIITGITLTVFVSPSNLQTQLMEQELPEDESPDIKKLFLSIRETLYITPYAIKKATKKRHFHNII